MKMATSMDVYFSWEWKNPSHAHNEMIEMTC